MKILPGDLIHAHFFFVDIVSLSDPKSSTKTQIKKIEGLTNCFSECDAYKSADKENILLNTTGDGFWVGFLQGPELPLQLAMQLQSKLEEYNKSKIPSETINVRIGLHSGICYVVKNITGDLDAWGPGIVLARRIMDIGDDGHILLSSRLAEDLREISDEYQKIIKPIHDYTLKHDITMLVYSAYGDGFGNKKIPTKGITEKSKMKEELTQIQKSTIYSSVFVGLTIKDSDTMLTHHKRVYQMKNISDNPIQYVLHGIGTDVKKESLHDLNVKIYDESGQSMKISSINMNKPYSKEFRTTFVRPIKTHEQNRGYTLEYDVEEPNRYFENAFLADCEKFTLSFEYTLNGSIISPVLFDLNQETEQKKLSKIIPTITKSNQTILMEWNFENFFRGSTLRLEW